MNIRNGGVYAAPHSLPQPPILGISGKPSHPLGSVAFSGELYKLSSRKVLASWKSRFFVLDTEHYQMRYYDTSQDEIPRGFIDLQDIRAIRLLHNATSVPRRFQDGCTFEVSRLASSTLFKSTFFSTLLIQFRFVQIDTPLRQYRFAADDSRTAGAWVERIQSAIL